MQYFYFHKLQLIAVLLLICDFHMSWSTRFVSQKLCLGFSILDSILFVLDFCPAKYLGYWCFENNFFQN